MDANSANLYLAISSAFRDADNVLIKLATRFDEDYENMRGNQGGQQTVDDLQALVSKGIGALCQRAGIPPAQIIGIARHEVVKNWLEEVVLKRLLFTLPSMGKGPEVFKLHPAIDAHFGKELSNLIASAALSLAQQFIEASQRRDFDRMTAILSQSVVGVSKLEYYHRQFTELF